MNYDPMLVCPICSDLSNDPYECKKCNQTYCKDCTEELRNFCAKCGQASGFQYSRLARKIINDTEVSCKYCGKLHKKGETEVHYSNCDKFKISCKYTGCKFSGSKNDFFEHVIVFHKSELIDIFTREHHEEFLVTNHGMLMWQNGQKSYTKKSNGKYLYSTKLPVKRLTQVIVQFSDCKDYNYCQVGFSSTKMDGADKYLGGETGKGTWGLSGNGIIGEEGKWNKNFANLLKYGREEIILKFNKGVIQVTVGSKGNSYLYNLGIPEAYLTVLLYHDGGKVNIVSDSEMAS
jgi:hypothetical protein